jgi:hypothetical protein
MTFKLTVDNTITAWSNPPQIQPDEQAFEYYQEFNAAALTWPSSRLADIWNKLPGVTPVAKFMNKERGSARIWEQLENLAPEPEPEPEPKQESETGSARSVRPGTKAALVIGMLSGPDGATLGAIMDATGWQSHTCQGFIAGTLGTKLGLDVESIGNGSKLTRKYRILNPGEVNLSKERKEPRARKERPALVPRAELVEFQLRHLRDFVARIAGMSPGADTDGCDDAGTLQGLINEARALVGPAAQ